MTSNGPDQSRPDSRMDSTEDATLEPSDVNPRAITWAGVSLVLMLVAASFIVTGIRACFSPSGPKYRDAEQLQRATFQQVKQPKQVSPGVPIRPERELARVREQESKKLIEYRWVDPSRKQFARIPVQRAAEILSAEPQDTHTSGELP